MRIITDAMFATRQASENTCCYDNLSAEEKDKFLKLYCCYSDLLYKWFVPFMKLEEYDGMIETGRHRFKKIDEENMDIYQYLASDYLQYFYIRNNLHIERLSEEEMGYLENKLNSGDEHFSTKDAGFIEKTFLKVLPERIAVDATKHVHINYGPSSQRFFQPDNAIIIGYRYDTYYKFDDEDDETWSHNHLQREFQLDLIVFCLKKDSDAKGKLYNIPICVVQYDDFSVHPIRNGSSNK